MPVPDLPVLPAEDSLLSRKFGRETANYFSGSPLNRLSFLRSEVPFLRAAFSHPRARFLLLRDLAPLVRADDPARLAFARYADVVPLTGPDPFALSEEEMIARYDSSEEQVIIVFLGVDEKKGDVLPRSEAEPPEPGEEFAYKGFNGSPYFAVDVTPRGKKAAAAEEVIKKVTERGFTFYDSSPRHMGLLAGQG